MKLWGPAFTVRGRSGDNLALHRALAAAHEGDVIVAQLTGDVERGHWGDLMSIAAQAVGLAGLVIDASIKDKASIGVRGFPVFHRGTQPSPAAKQFAGELQILVTIHGVPDG
jgi:4-hydroxy-4-methyl-2-oxoglutarate aldolase